MIDRSHFLAGTGLRFTCSSRLLAKGSLSSKNWPQVLAMWLSYNMNFIFSKAVEYPLSSWWRQRLIQHNIIKEVTMPSSFPCNVSWLREQLCHHVCRTCPHKSKGITQGVRRGVGDEQGDLACCSSWGRKELDMTERLNWTELKKAYTGCEYSTVGVLDSTLEFCCPPYPFQNPH